MISSLLDIFFCFITFYVISNWKNNPAMKLEVNSSDSCIAGGDIISSEKNYCFKRSNDFSSIKNKISDVEEKEKYISAKIEELSIKLEQTKKYSGIKKINLKKKIIEEIDNLKSEILMNRNNKSYLNLQFDNIENNL